MEEENKPFVSVIIPTYHDWERLQLCLDALEQQTYPKENFEIIVVNNDPKDQPPAELVLPENCLLIEESKPGSYAARNKGISIAKGEIFAFTDSDCQPSVMWIQVGVNELVANRETHRVGGSIKFIKKQKKSLDYYYEVAFGLDQKRFIDLRNAAVTANMFSWKSVFSNVGLFDCTLMSGGDVEWGERACRHGYRIVYNDKAYVLHPARSLSEIISKARRTAGGVYEIEKKKGNKKILFLFIITLIPPVKSIARAMLDSRIPIFGRFNVCIFRLIVRYVSLAEIFFMLLGKPARRS